MSQVKRPLEIRKNEHRRHVFFILLLALSYNFWSKLIFYPWKVGFEDLLYLLSLVIISHVLFILDLWIYIFKYYKNSGTNT